MGTMNSLSRALPLSSILDIIRFVLPDITDLREWPTETVDAPNLALDRAFIATYLGVMCFIHIEMQSWGDYAMPRRVYHYAARLNMSSEKDIPVYTIVIWFNKDSTPEPIYRQRQPDGTYNEWRYHEIKLFELTKADLDRGGPGLLALSPFIQDVSEPDILPLAQRLKTEAPPGVAEILLAIFAAMAEYRFAGIDLVEILTKVGMRMDAIRDIIEHSSVAVALAERVRAESLAEGKAQGIAEGKAEGIAQALIVLWPTRFGAAPSAAVREALHQATPETLQTVLDHWATDSLQEMQGRLGITAE